MKLCYAKREFSAKLCKGLERGALSNNYRAATYLLNNTFFNHGINANP
jgi:hypothetical protein